MMHSHEVSARPVETKSSVVGFVLLCFLTAALGPFSAARAEVQSGALIYQQKCAVCHGANGEGSDDHYGSPLIGDRSLHELTELIVDTMPEEDPDECVGEEAEKVARYVYDAFYSEIAQARNRPAEIEFSRLTVRQYEHAVTDLLGSFTWNGGWADDHGLKAEYFRTRRFRGNERLVERVDPQINFDFGEGVPIELPAPEKDAEKGSDESDAAKNDAAEEKKDEEDKSRFTPEEFSIRWQGSIMAPETGNYEFILEVNNGARLWVNDGSTPLIDAWVKSGDHSEYRETIRLLGGRPYFIRVDFFKFKDETASIRLKWKPPHHAEEVIHARYLATSRMHAQFVITT
ncbi:MAG: PA14 domain-containing protein, partial [Maioricimonas sp. JB049]